MKCPYCNWESEEGANAFETLKKHDEEKPECRDAFAKGLMYCPQCDDYTLHYDGTCSECEYSHGDDEE